MQTEESLGAGVTLFILFQISEEAFVHLQHDNQCEGTPRVTVSPLSPAGKARGGRLEHCSGEDAGSTRSLEGQSLVWWKSEGVAEYQKSLF